MGRIPRLFIIYAMDTADPLYYSRELGWTDLSECEIYDEEDKKLMSLPKGGQWYEVSQEQALDILAK